LDTATPAFTYTAPGDYVVQLTLENLCVSEVITHEVSVCEYLVQGVGFAVSPNPRSNTVVTFTATAIGPPPLTYAWDFGDHSTGSGSVATHEYATGGDYTVTLTASNCGGCSCRQAVRVIAVCDSIHDVDFSVSPSPALLNQMVTFTTSVQGTAPIAYAWDFGDGQAGTGITITHAYTTAGTYTVTLVTTNCGDAQADVTRPIHVVAYKFLYLPLIFKGS
jgi:PKD repeat protein